MNKQERRQKGELKRKQRAVHYPGWTNNYILRNTAKPCLCIFFSPGKILSNGQKKKEYKELQFELAA